MSKSLLARNLLRFSTARFYSPRIRPAFISKVKQIDSCDEKFREPAKMPVEASKATTLQNPTPIHSTRNTTRSWTVDKFEHEILLKKFLQFHLEFPISLTEKLMRLGKIWVFRSGERSERVRDISAKTLLYEGDRVFVRHQFRDIPKHSVEDLIMNPPILAADKDRILNAILYKDEDILVINKPNDLAVHGGSKNSVHLQRFFESLKLDAKETPRLVHRLDKKTSGVLVLARNRIAAVKLSAMFHRSSDPSELMIATPPSIDAFGNVIRDPSEDLPSAIDELAEDLAVEKTYWAILTEIPSVNRGLIDRHLYIPPESGVDLSSIEDGEEIPKNDEVTLCHPGRIPPILRKQAKRAITNFEVIEKIGKRGCWVRLSPQTGRKHQLRVHCAKVLKCPILGDFKYGISSYKKLHEIGWGHILNFSRYTGIQARETKMPQFLHLRQLVIRNYFKHLGKGGCGDSSQSSADLLITASLPFDWKELMKGCNLDSSIKS